MKSFFRGTQLTVNRPFPGNFGRKLQGFRLTFPYTFVLFSFLCGTQDFVPGKRLPLLDRFIAIPLKVIKLFRKN